jgi:hydrogenase maturation factor HypF (carbamoyltransferase family)
MPVKKVVPTMQVKVRKNISVLSSFGTLTDGKSTPLFVMNGSIYKIEPAIILAVSFRNPKSAIRN